MWIGSSFCVAHPATPQFVFELLDETVRLRLLARSERDQSVWLWNGHEWQPNDPRPTPSDKPEILDDPRLEPVTQWLGQLDWFPPEPGLWVGDANESFLSTLGGAWPDRPEQAEYLGNASFHRLFLNPRQLRPRLVIKGTGIDWLSVSAEWEQEGLKLSAADLRRLQTSSGRFVKLPDSGWVELDSTAVQSAHEAMADLGVDGLIPVPHRIGIEHAAHLDDEGLKRFGDSPEAQALRERLKDFKGTPPTDLPESIQAELRPYQKEGFNFLCHLTRIKLGGILADDMGLGKTLQTLAWLAWLQERNDKNPKPSLVICPASVLHNWRREANRFTPHLKVLVLESGAARHNLRRQIPQHDLIVTNYALLRRDLEALQKFAFYAVILDEAQFIKNPAAQGSRNPSSQLRADQTCWRWTGTPLGEPPAGFVEHRRFLSNPATSAPRNISPRRANHAVRTPKTPSASPAAASRPNCGRSCCAASNSAWLRGPRRTRIEQRRDFASCKARDQRKPSPWPNICAAAGSRCSKPWRKEGLTKAKSTCWRH